LGPESGLSQASCRLEKEDGVWGVGCRTEGRGNVECGLACVVGPMDERCCCAADDVMMLGLGAARKEKQREADRQRHGPIPRPNPSVVENTCSCPVLFKTLCSAVCLFAESGFSKQMGHVAPVHQCQRPPATPKFLAAGGKPQSRNHTTHGRMRPASRPCCTPVNRHNSCSFTQDLCLLLCGLAFGVALNFLSMITSKARPSRATSPKPTTHTNVLL
jgi:hypothetical protein